MTTEDGYRVPQPPLVIGETIGQLTVVAIEGDRVRCDCACGATDVLRDKSNLRASRLLAQTPMCKRCQKQQRKRTGSKMFGKRWTPEVGT